MPSWVVPTVAAEYWGVSVEQVMADVAGGRVPSRTESGFLFVDVDPAREAPVPIAAPAYRRPLAWTPTVAPDAIVTSEERDALLDTSPVEEPAPIALSEDDIPNWDQVRARVGRTRRPPRSSAAAA